MAGLGQSCVVHVGVEVAEACPPSGVEGSGINTKMDIRQADISCRRTFVGHQVLGNAKVLRVR